MIDNLQSSSGRRLSADDGEYQDKIDALEREVASVKAEQQADKQALAALKEEQQADKQALKEELKQLAAAVLPAK